MTEATGPDGDPARADTRRRVTIGLLAAGAALLGSVQVLAVADALRGGGLVTWRLTGESWVLGSSVDLVLWVLPSAIALVGLARDRPWGPAAAVVGGLVAVVPATVLGFLAFHEHGEHVLTWLLLAHVLVVAAGVVAATTLPWGTVTPTPARTLLWLGAVAVTAGRALPVGAEAGGAESLAALPLSAVLLEPGAGALELALALVGVLTLLAAATMVARLPVRVGIGGAAVLATVGLAPVSNVLWTLRFEATPLLASAALGPVGAIALLLWLRDATRQGDAGRRVLDAVPR